MYDMGKIRTFMKISWLFLFLVQIKSRSQIFPLCGASVYEKMKKTGEVTYARDPGALTKEFAF